MKRKQPQLEPKCMQRLATDMPKNALETLATTEPLSALPELAPRILEGQTGGRIVIDVNA